MTDKNTATGKVARVTEWSSHKGYFLNLKDDSNDYYGFGKCGADIGSTVTIEVSEGTGSFSDKIKIDKFAKKVDLNAVRKETADKDLKIVEDSIISGENMYFARQNLIIRQTCIKAASNCIGLLLAKEEKVDLALVSNRIHDMAEQLYAWVTESDQKLPEPPEEP